MTHMVEGELIPALSSDLHIRHVLTYVLTHVLTHVLTRVLTHVLTHVQ